MAGRSDVSGTTDTLNANNGSKIQVSDSIFNMGGSSGCKYGNDQNGVNEVSTKDPAKNDSVVPKCSESPTKGSDGRSSDSENENENGEENSGSSDSENGEKNSGSSSSDSENENKNGGKKKNDRSKNKKGEQKLIK